MRDERVLRDRAVARGPGDDKPDSMHSLVLITHLVYGLHAFALFSGLIGSVAILLSFLASIPSIVAVVLNYIKRDAVRGTWLESHFRWQIRSFWYAVLWVFVSIALLITVIGALFGFLLLLITSFWVVYRVVRGWWVLMHGRSLPMD